MSCKDQLRFNLKTDSIYCVHPRMGGAWLSKKVCFTCAFREDFKEELTLEIAKRQMKVLASKMDLYKRAKAVALLGDLLHYIICSKHFLINN